MDAVMNTVLFDLDGTLLPMDLNDFMKAYFGKMASRAAAAGYDPREFSDAILKGLYATIASDGSMTNEDRFWAIFAEVLGNEILERKPMFDEFYENEFRELGALFPADPLADVCVKRLKEKGYTVALATSPLYPRVATLERCRWAGVDPADFELISTYEDYCYAKPNPGYYKEVFRRLGKKPEECLMVGNDMIEDMAAAKLGTDIFFLTDFLINKEGTDITPYKHGRFEDLLAYIETLPDVNEVL